MTPLSESASHSSGERG